MGTTHNLGKRRCAQAIFYLNIYHSLRVIGAAKCIKIEGFVKYFPNGYM